MRSFMIATILTLTALQTAGCATSAPHHRTPALTQETADGELGTTDPGYDAYVTPTDSPAKQNAKAAKARLFDQWHAAYLFAR